MWKESYNIGVERIDFQHKSLFEKVEEFMRAIEEEAGPYTYQQILNFLKGYVVFHFRDEEKYQESIGYKGIVAHKEAHRVFTETVLDYERRLEADNYSLPLVKELAGILTAWLVYHVAYTDQQIVQANGRQFSKKKESPLHVVADSLSGTLEALTGIESSHFHIYDASALRMDPAVTVEVGLFGDVNGTLQYGFSGYAASSLFQRMTMQIPESLDEMVRSALAEVANITSGNATVQLAHNGLQCDITTPKVTTGGETSSFNGLVLDIGEGTVQFATDLDRY